MVSPNNVYALITGASKGLGKALALELASRKINLLLVALHNEGLPELCEHIRKAYKVTVYFLETDLIQENSVVDIVNWAADKEICVLINNAGVGGSGIFSSAGINYLDMIIKINIRSITHLTYLLLPQLKKHPKSFILNISSMASFSPIAYKTIYPASKAFVSNFSLCLNEELKSTGVSVSVLHPGPMLTNQDVSLRINNQSKFAKLGVMPPEIVARIAIKKLFERQPMVIPGFFNQLNWLLMKLVPCKIKIPLISSFIKRELNINEDIQPGYQINRGEKTDISLDLKNLAVKDFRSNL